jgi:hypothetical protein
MTQRTFLIRLAIVFIAVTAFFFIRSDSYVKELNTNETALRTELSQLIFQTETLLRELQNEEFARNRNFPADALERGIETTSAAKSKLASRGEVVRKINALRQSKIIFTRLFAEIFLRDKATPSFQEIFAALDETEKEFTWWREFQEAIKELMVYDPELDLRSRSLDSPPRDYIKRLYLAKGGLLRMQKHFKNVERIDNKGIAGQLLKTVSSNIALIDNLIKTTNEGRSDESNELRNQYITRMQIMKGDLVKLTYTIYSHNQFAALFEKLRAIKNKI